MTVCAYIIEIVKKRDSMNVTEDSKTKKKGRLL